MDSHGENHLVVTVTLNPAVDKAMIIPHLTVGATNRAEVERIDPGGKGVNVAKALKQFGCSVLATGFLAGSHGRLITEGLAARDIPADFIQVPGETRVNLKIKDPVARTETEINEPGFHVDAKYLKQLENKLETYAGRCAAVVLSGSLPPGVPTDVYAGLIRIARRGGAKVVLDTNGEALRRGVVVPPDLIKPNQAELAQWLGTKIENEAQLVAAARQPLALGVSRVVVSLGADGALAASARQVWRARCPALQARSSVGAGDAMVAALVYALLNNLPEDEALRLATAAGSATASMSGSRVADFKLIQEFLPRIQMEKLA
jgi:1-phosphofructokinase